MADEVRSYFKEMVFDTIIHRNSKVSEAPNMQIPVVLYDARSKGAINYFNLAIEFLRKNQDNPLSSSEEKETSKEVVS